MIAPRPGRRQYAGRAARISSGCESSWPRARVRHLDARALVDSAAITGSPASRASAELPDARNLHARVVVAGAVAAVGQGVGHERVGGGAVARVVAPQA